MIGSESFPSGQLWTFSSGHRLLHEVEEALLLFEIEDFLYLHDDHR